MLIKNNLLFIELFKNQPLLLPLDRLSSEDMFECEDSSSFLLLFRSDLIGVSWRLFMNSNVSIGFLLPSCRRLEDFSSSVLFLLSSLHFLSSLFIVSSSRLFNSFSNFSFLSNVCFFFQLRVHIRVQYLSSARHRLAASSSIAFLASRYLSFSFGHPS
jgi:hypothetical protein